MKEKQIHNTNHWIRKIYRVPSASASLVLHDHRANNFGAVTIENGSSTRADVAGKPDDPICFLEQLKLANSHTSLTDTWHVVCHSNTSRESFALNPESLEGAPVPLFASEKTGEKVIVLQVTTLDSLPDQHSPAKLCAGNNYVWLSMKHRGAYRMVSAWLPEFLKLTFDQAKRLAGFKTRAEAHEFETEFSHFLDIILPGRMENLLAFRLLCEATKVVEEENTKRTAKGEQTSNTALLSNITIHAPSNPAEWLAPFGKKPDESKAIEHVAGLIGSDKVKARAEAVLKAVNGETLQKRIGEFLNPEADPSAQP